MINQKLCQQKISKVNSLLEESQKVKELTAKIQENEDMHNFSQMQLKMESLQKQLTLKDEMISLQKKMIDEIRKKKNDKNKLIVKLKAKIVALEQENKLLKGQSKVSQVYQPQQICQDYRADEASYQAPSDDDQDLLSLS